MANQQQQIPGGESKYKAALFAAVGSDGEPTLILKGTSKEVSALIVAACAQVADSCGMDISEYMVAISEAAEQVLPMPRRA